MRKSFTGRGRRGRVLSGEPAGLHSHVRMPDEHARQRICCHSAGKSGFRLTDDEGDADILIVNTCSVREKAEDKAIGNHADGCAEMQRRITDLVEAVGAIGCMAQRMGETLFRTVRKLDFAIGPNSLARLPDAIETALAGEGPVVDTGGEREDDPAMQGHRATLSYPT